MAKSAICFVTDAHYLLPTLVAAGQARRWSAPALAEVIVTALDLAPPLAARAEAAFSQAGARMVQGRAVEMGGDPVMARLFLHHLLPPTFDRLLYLDADIQVVASLDPLLASPPPAGHLRAALDPMALLVRRGGRPGAMEAARMRQGGVPASHHAHYFNSGVLHMGRADWDALAHEAFRVHRAGGLFPDQDALNIVAAGRVLEMSLAWNFPIFLRNARLDRMIRPAVLHFMARPKPWDGTFPPWSAAHCRPYAEMRAQWPDLAASMSPMPPMRRARYALQQRAKQLRERILWGRGALLEVVQAAEREVALGGS
jgi:lipopolysaccharide biosynthesis glycosyltransferase